MAYKIIDNQMQGRFFADEVEFDTLEEVKDQLKSYHDADNDTEKWSLLDCLEIGMWGIVDAETGEEIDYNLIKI